MKNLAPLWILQARYVTGRKGFGRVSALNARLLVLNGSVSLAGENNWLKRLLRALPLSKKIVSRLTKEV